MCRADGTVTVVLEQKLLFYSTPEDIKYKIRPYWAENVRGRATLVQALDDMLEILPPGQSKGAGVKLLLDNLGVHPEEVGATVFFSCSLVKGRVSCDWKDVDASFLESKSGAISCYFSHNFYPTDHGDRRWGERY